MTWVDRIAEAAYSSPSGVRTVFDYEDVSRTFDKKTSAYDFPDAVGTAIQDFGRTGRKYPVKVIFSGPDHDVTASAFEDSLAEPGVGTLEHPFYGEVNVVPFGTVTREDRLKTAANQSVISVTFWEASDLSFPGRSGNPASEIRRSLESFNSAAGLEFEQNVSLATVAAETQTRGGFLSLVNGAINSLTALARSDSATALQFAQVSESVLSALDTTLETPAILAQQVAFLIQIPARVEVDVFQRLELFAGLTDSVISAEPEVFSPNSDSAQVNLFHVRDLLGMSYVSASVTSAINTQFLTRGEALETAERILAQLDAVVQWRELNYQQLASVDTGAAYQQLQQAVALTAGFLVEISFTVRQERSLVLERERTIIDLVAELYGEVDSELDFFISSNQLTGSEILELPRGRRIVYYV